MDGDGTDRPPSKQKLRRQPAALEVVRRRPALSLEDQTLYLSLVKDLTNEKRPANPTESTLVEEIARNYVRLQRARRLETEILDKHLAEVQTRFRKPLESGKALAIVFMEHGAQLESMQRKEAKIEDAWYRVMAELDHEQANRRKSDPEAAGPVDPKAKRIHLVRKKRNSEPGAEGA